VERAPFSVAKLIVSNAFGGPPLEPLTPLALLVGIGCNVGSHLLETGGVKTYKQIAKILSRGTPPENHDVLRATQGAYVAAMEVMAKASTYIAVDPTEIQVAKDLEARCREPDFRGFRYDGEHFPLFATSDAIDRLFSPTFNKEDLSRKSGLDIAFSKLVVEDLEGWGIHLPALLEQLFTDGFDGHPPWHETFRVCFSEQVKHKTECFRILTFERLNDIRSLGFKVIEEIDALARKIDALQIGQMEIGRKLDSVVTRLETDPLRKAVEFVDRTEARNVADGVNEAMRHWLGIHDLISENRSKLEAAARAYYSARSSAEGLPRDFPLLTRNEWLFSPPMQLPSEQLSLSYDPLVADMSPAVILTPGQVERYSALLASSPDGHLIRDDDCYRLLGVATNGPRIELTFGLTNYCQYLDSVEALSLEFAAGWQSVEANEEIALLPSRGDLHKAFDLRNRSLVAGLNALFVVTNFRSHPNAVPKTVFFIHDRRRTAEARFAKHVVPAGTFQPTFKYNTEHDQDFSFENRLILETLEEFFSLKELEQQCDAPPRPA
jgi:hypothetical protein